MIYKETRTGKTVIALFFFSVFSVFSFQNVWALNSEAKLSDIRVVKGIVQKGDTISYLLNKYLALKTIYKINRLSSDVFSLASIRKGRPYKIILLKNRFSKFEYGINKKEKVVVEKLADEFSIKRQPIEYDVNLEIVTSTITSTLFEATRKSGEKIELAWKLSDIFAWDIDFTRDIQPGDRFKVLVDKKYHNDKLVGYGRIKAAFFLNKGKVFKAFWYKNSKGVSGYYDENGNSLEKTFLKAPIEFSRISSRFSKSRFHPIFKEFRPHKGVDYAAPAGTPIKAVGDGIISSIGFKTGFGKCIEIRHYNGYVTSYNHMSRFASKSSKNSKVQQGDVIGYVGTTGYTTSPHLDFRMKKNGKLINPLKDKSPRAKPVDPEEMELFLAKTKKLSMRILMAGKSFVSKKSST